MFSPARNLLLDHIEIISSIAIFLKDVYLNYFIPQITEELEAIKTQMDEKGTTMTDSGPLVKIKQAITKVKNELIQMELRIGVVSYCQFSYCQFSYCHLVTANLVTANLVTANLVILPT